MTSKTRWLAAFLCLGVLCPPAFAGSRLELGKNAALTRTVIVSPGSSEAEGGANLKAALASADGIASRPCLVKIEPGVYDLGGTVLNMRPFVDLEGSGQGLTVIRSDNTFIGTVQGSSDAEIRDLTIVNTFAGDGFGIGLENVQASPTVRNVTIEVTAGCSRARGIRNDRSSPVLLGVSVHAAGSQDTCGILSHDSTPFLRDVAVNAATSSADHNVYGIVITGGGTEENPVRLHNVEVGAAGGKAAYGIQVQGAVLDADQVRAQAENGDFSYGLEIAFNSVPARVANATVTAKGGFYATGIRMDTAPASFSDVASAATGAAIQNIGMDCSNDDVPRVVRIDNCRIGGNSFSIHNTSLENMFYVGASKLEGPVSAAGSWFCAHCYDGTNAELDDSCQGE